MSDMSVLYRRRRTNAGGQLPRFRPVLPAAALVFALWAPHAGAQGSRYVYGDGTGDQVVDSLNAAQIGAAYKGPYYYPGQAVPPARVVTLGAGGTETAASGGVLAGASVAPVVTSTVPSSPLQGAPKGTSGYGGALYYPQARRGSLLPPPSPH